MRVIRPQLEATALRCHHQQILPDPLRIAPYDESRPRPASVQQAFYLLAKPALKTVWTHAAPTLCRPAFIASAIMSSSMALKKGHFAYAKLGSNSPNSSAPCVTCL